MGWVLRKAVRGDSNTKDDETIVLNTVGETSTVEPESDCMQMLDNDFQSIEVVTNLDLS